MKKGYLNFMIDFRSGFLSLDQISRVDISIPRLIVSDLISC